MVAPRFTGHYSGRAGVKAVYSVSIRKRFTTFQNIVLVLVYK